MSHHEFQVPPHLQPLDTRRLEWLAARRATLKTTEVHPLGVRWCWMVETADRSYFGVGIRGAIDAAMEDDGAEPVARAAGLEEEEQTS